MAAETSATLLPPFALAYVLRNDAPRDLALATQPVADPETVAKLMLQNAGVAPSAAVAELMEAKAYSSVTFALRTAYIRLIPSMGLLAVVSSKCDVTVYSHQVDGGVLEPVSHFVAAQEAVRDVLFVMSSDRKPFICCSSIDGSVSMWDAVAGSLVHVFRQPGGSPVECIASDGQHLAAGTAGNVLIWELASRKALGILENMHTEPVHALAFHPLQPLQLFSGSEDGLINHYDLSAGDVDDMLQTVLPIEQPVGRFGFFGPSNEFVYVISTVETLSLWAIDSGECIFNFVNVRKVLSEACQVPVNYLVECAYFPDSKRLFLVAGSNSGDIFIFHVNTDSIQPVIMLRAPEAHNAPVRDVEWLDHTVITIAEDNKVCLWTSEPKVALHAKQHWEAQLAEQRPGAAPSPQEEDVAME